MSAETSQTLDRGLRALEVLAAAHAGMTVTELAGRLSVNRTVVYRLVTTLEQHSLIHKDGRGRLHVGVGVLPLAAAVRPVLRDVAAPVLRELAEELGCTAHLSVADGGEAVALAVAEPSWTDFHISYRVGTRHLLGEGSPGKAILLGRSSRADSAAYVMTSGELQPGARGWAAPILGLEGLEASVGIICMSDLEAEVVGTRVVAAAARLSDDLQGRMATLRR
jgi:DNA-binding IclR family transcriptional regulator